MKKAVSVLDTAFLQLYDSPIDCRQEGVQKEHYGKTDTADKGQLFGFLRRGDSGDQSQQDPSGQPAEKCAEGVGHQIVDIRSPVSKDL